MTTPKTDIEKFVAEAARAALAVPAGTPFEAELPAGVDQQAAILALAQALDTPPKE